jgi:hypothetical protein
MKNTIQPSKNTRHLSFVYYLIFMGCTLCGPAVLTAQNGVTVSGLAVNAGTVTFDVSWKNTGMPAVWSDTVWVFVDYNESGKMIRLPLSPGATLTATSTPGVGKVIEIPGNNQGVWVAGNARITGSFSATVQLTTSISAVGGACAYASNDPPVGKYNNDASNISFTGTSPYVLAIRRADGNAETVISGSSYHLPPGFKLETFTDATGAPGIFECVPMTGMIDFSTVPSMVAKGQSVSFIVNAAPSIPPPPSIIYSWSAPGFVPATYVGTPFNTTAPPVADTYPVTLYAHGSGYCDLSEDRAIIVVDCLNPAIFDLTTSASASSFCAGNNTGFTFALSGTENGRNYQLFRDAMPVGMLVGTGSAATFSGTYDVTGVYTVASIADGTYCSLLMNGSHAITVSPVPSDLTLTATPAVICSGQPAILTASATDGEFYSIDNNAWQTSPVFNVSPVSNTSYTLYVRAAGGCSATKTNAVILEVKPAFTITTQPAGANICAGNTVQLSVAAANATSYQWKKNGVDVNDGSGGTSANYTTGTLNSSATYTVEVSNGACSVMSEAAVVTVNTPPEAPTSLSSDIPTICSGMPTVMSLTATGGTTGSGAVYEWGTGGTVGNNPLSPPTTTANVRIVNPSVATIYWVRLLGTGSCSATVTGGVMAAITEYPAVTPGAIQGGEALTLVDENPYVTIGSAADATGGGGNIIYEWRRTGKSAKTLEGSNATTYAIGSDASNYEVAGTYAFNRYAKDATCNTAWVAASGTYVLTVKSPGPPGGMPTTVCAKCCWDGTTWVDCHVSTHVYPFDSDFTNTKIDWASLDAYNQKARSDRDGRANTNAIIAATSPGTHAVYVCQSLGEGWYLPAYEELVNMSDGRLNTPLNGFSGARLLNFPANSYYWSSTETYENGGRYSKSDVSLQHAAVMVYNSAELSHNHKHYKNYVRCVWRD